MREQDRRPARRRRRAASQVALADAGAGHPPGGWRLLLVESWDTGRVGGLGLYVFVG